eukprot:1241559-Prymnesium_polylepis.1
MPASAGRPPLFLAIHSPSAQRASARAHARRTGCAAQSAHGSASAPSSSSISRRRTWATRRRRACPTCSRPPRRRRRARRSARRCARRRRSSSRRAACRSSSRTSGRRCATASASGASTGTRGCSRSTTTPRTRRCSRAPSRSLRVDRMGIFLRVYLVAFVGPCCPTRPPALVPEVSGHVWACLYVLRVPSRGPLPAYPAKNFLQVFAAPRPN